MCCTRFITLLICSFKFGKHNFWVDTFYGSLVHSRRTKNLFKKHKTLAIDTHNLCVGTLKWGTISELLLKKTKKKTTIKRLYTVCGGTKSFDLKKVIDFFLDGKKKSVYLKTCAITHIKQRKKKLVLYISFGFYRSFSM